jgi:colicin import membrane protein
MSTVIEPKRKVTPPPADNPFYYGWRDAYQTLPDGTRKHITIPLTLEDTLHPQEGDYIVESKKHTVFRLYLFGVFHLYSRYDPEALVLSDTPIYWDHPALDHHAPDVCLVFGVKRQKDDWSSFFVRDEGVWPHAIVELVSPNTRENDVETKFVEYHMAKVPFYFIFDREREEDPWTLRGYEWKPFGYASLNTDLTGRIWLAALGICLAAEGQKIVCYDGKTNERIPDFVENAEWRMNAEAELQKAAIRQEAEKRRADAEKQRADAEKQRADAEKQRADAEKQRAEIEMKQTEAEKRRADAAEAKLKDIQAELERLRGQ